MIRIPPFTSQTYNHFRCGVYTLAFASAVFVFLGSAGQISILLVQCLLVAYRSGYVVLGTTFHLKTSDISALNYHELCLQPPGQFCFRVAVFRLGGKRNGWLFIPITTLHQKRNGNEVIFILQKISTGTQRAGQDCLSLQRDTKVRLPGKTYANPTEYLGCTHLKITHCSSETKI